MGRVKTARNVELRCFSERCRFYSEMWECAVLPFWRLSNRALAAIGGKCRCGPLGRRGMHRIRLVGRAVGDAGPYGVCMFGRMCEGERRREGTPPYGINIR